ncbi:MAG: hypothetical protein ACYC8T_20345 [Myxococcaceae bacterium]
MSDEVSGSRENTLQSASAHGWPERKIAEAALKLRWIGWFACFVFTAALGAWVLATFGNDKVVPLAVVALTLALVTLEHIWLARPGQDLVASIAAECETMSMLGQQGAQLGDCLVHIGDRRRDMVAEFQEQVATWANLLVVLGMVGTATYLVVHASDFITLTGAASGNLQTGLLRLLPLAPKAFAASGLGLASAGAIGLAGSLVLRRIGRLAPDTKAWIGAWSDGTTQFRTEVALARQQEEADRIGGALAKAFDEHILGRLSALPDTMGALDRSVRDLAAQLAKSADASSTHAEKSAGAVASLMAVCDGASKLLDGYSKMEAEITSSMSQASHSLETRLAEHQHALHAEMSGHAHAHLEAVRDMNGAILEATRATTERFSKEAEAAARGLTDLLQATVAKTSGSIDQLHAHLRNEATKNAVEMVRPIIENVSQNLVDRMNEQAHKVVEVLQSMEINSFERAEAKFRAAVEPAAAQIEALASSVKAVAEQLRQLDGLVQTSAPTWGPSVERARAPISALSSDLIRLSEAGGPLQQVCATLDAASRRLAQSSESAAEQSRLLGQIESIVASGRL